MGPAAAYGTMRFCDVELVRFEAAIPPHLGDEAVWAAVARYREGMADLARFANTPSPGDILCGGDPAVAVVRHRAGRATHTLDVICPARHHDLFAHELAAAVVAACPPPPGSADCPGGSTRPTSGPPSGRKARRSSASTPAPRLRGTSTSRCAPRTPGGSPTRCDATGLRPSSNPLVTVKPATVANNIVKDYPGDPDSAGAPLVDACCARLLTPESPRRPQTPTRPRRSGPPLPTPARSHRLLGGAPPPRQKRLCQRPV